mgnify:CR=1 FL=1
MEFLYYAGNEKQLIFGFAELSKQYKVDLGIPFLVKNENDIKILLKYMERRYSTCSNCENAVGGGEYKHTKVIIKLQEQCKILAKDYKAELIRWIRNHNALNKDFVKLENFKI